MPGGLQRWSRGRLVDVPRMKGGSRSVFDVEPTPHTGDKGAGSCVAVAQDGMFRCEAGRLVPVTRRSVTAPTRARSLIDRGPDGEVWGLTGTTVYRGRTPVFDTESSVKSLFFGRRGTVWVGTARHGLFRLQRRLPNAIERRFVLSFEIAHLLDVRVVVREGLVDVGKREVELVCDVSG